MTSTIEKLNTILGRAVVEAFLVATDEFPLHFCDLVGSDFREVSSLGEILADQAAGVLVEPSLPRVLRIWKVGIGFEDLGQQLLQGKLLAVVVGPGAHILAMRVHEPQNHGSNLACIPKSAAGYERVAA